MYMARATLARLPSTKTIFWPRNVTPPPPPDVSNPLKACDTEKRVLKGLQGNIEKFTDDVRELVLSPEHHHEDHHDGKY